MGVAKFEITRKCKNCGKPLVAKTITSWYCSPRCSKVAFKRRKDEEKKISVWMIFSLSFFLDLKMCQVFLVQVILPH